MVTGIGHGAWSAEEWRSWGLTHWQGSDVTLTTLQNLNIVPDLIVHVAGGASVAASLQDPLRDFDRTMATMAHVIEYARRTAPGCTIVYPSSASVYGATERMPIDEDTQPKPISQYGLHKLMAEEMISFAARQYGLRSAVVRFFSIYGCGLRKQLLWDACGKLTRNESLFGGTGDEVRDWLHVEDAARLTLFAARYASSDCPTVNGGRGEGVTVRALLEHLATSLNVDARPSFSGVRRHGDPSHYVADINRSLDWGWKPEIDWKASVAEYADWWLRTCA
jgi:UDP-glucose 4-epimerase